MSQVEQLLYEIERRGNRITTYELMGLRVSQYQRVLGELRERLAEKGITLTEAEPIEGQRRNFMYRLIKPSKQQELFVA